MKELMKEFRRQKKNYILDVGKKIYNETNSIIKANII